MKTTLRTKSQWQFWIDRGGTFTDIVAKNPQGHILTHKLLSENPSQYPDAAIAGIRHFLELGAQAAIPTEKIAAVRMGTTVATNALLERKGDRVVLVTSKGCRDALRIAYQQRPDLFALNVQLPDMLYEQVVETNERIDIHGKDLTKFDPEAIEDQLKKAFATGIKSIAIVFLHSYLHPKHEQEVAKLAKQIGFTYIACSHEVSPLIKYVSRGDTAMVDAYLAPILHRYLDFIQKELPGVNVQFMQSSGGLIKANLFRAKDSILSGPAGGVVGMARTAEAAGFDRVVGFDMGGTSTDVAHYAGEFETEFETVVAGVRMRVPMLNIHTIAAGGGSIVKFHQGRFQVGPESAGAKPGPACYRNGGPLTITDCNLVLGHLQATFFPKVFGPHHDDALDVDVVKQKFAEMCKQIKQETGQTFTPEQVAEGFVRVANDSMAGAIKKISIQQGHDILTHTLCCFGGAGGQHACGIADLLGIESILIHPHAGVLSAYGMGLADIAVTQSKMIRRTVKAKLPKINSDFDRLIKQAQAKMKAQKIDPKSCRVVKRLHVKYQGTDSIMPLDYVDSVATLEKRFQQQHRQRYGFTIPDKPIEIEMITVELVSSTPNRMRLHETIKPDKHIHKQTARVYLHGRFETVSVYFRSALTMRDKLIGPAVIIEPNSTHWLAPDWQAKLLKHGELLLQRTTSADKQSHRKKREISLTRPDPIMLEVFNNLFMSIAEQMGEALVNTAYSVNIKERRDFSCALFNAEGGLIANAPHVPVHLGSMSASVIEIIKERAGTMRPGDVYMLNDPYHGGTHLPDVTLITPVFAKGVKAGAKQKPVLFVASRGHQADIGGITPGSMPSDSKHIDEEGILFTNFQIVSQGKFAEAALVEKLTSGPYPTRNVEQNIGDLQAQIAANQKGVREVHKMLDDFGLKTVNAYMGFVQDNAEAAVKALLPSLKSGTHQCEMDCGVTIKVKIEIDATKHRAVIDFTGTSPRNSAKPHNFNAPKAVSIAAILYVFRCLVQQNIPLNQGCLKPFKIIIPDDCVLNPQYPDAVVAGNVETSQAIVNTLLAAMEIQAHAQGTMNNFTFGNRKYQYYETLAGGMGAGKDFNGASHVQCHMTNSAMTDTEVVEARFPIVVNEFSIRHNSGGKGQYHGGDGVVREVTFLEPMTVNILSNNRSHQPQGLGKGKPAKAGENQVVRQDGSVETLPASAKVEVASGDKVIIKTPGGGGYSR